MPSKRAAVSGSAVQRVRARRDPPRRPTSPACHRSDRPPRCRKDRPAASATAARRSSARHPHSHRPLRARLARALPRPAPPPHTIATVPVSPRRDCTPPYEGNATSTTSCRRSPAGAAPCSSRSGPRCSGSSPLRRAGRGCGPSGGWCPDRWPPRREEDMSLVDVRERVRDSPARARSLLTVRAAISSARSSEAPWSFCASLMCSY